MWLGLDTDEGVAQFECGTWAESGFFDLCAFEECAVTALKVCGDEPHLIALDTQVVSGDALICEDEVAFFGCSKEDRVFLNGDGFPLVRTFEDEQLAACGAFVEPFTVGRCDGDALGS